MDKFYTKPVVAEYFFNTLKNIINVDDFDICLEPSAGNGSFFNLLPPKKRMGLDIIPDHDEIIQMDFFNFVPQKNKKYICIGNPPFGRISSLAVKFFNKSAEFSQCIAFILPRTFKRVSVVNRLDEYFHLIYEEDVANNSFEPNMMAKCIFQIWIKKEIKREKMLLNSNTNDFIFCSPNKSDFAIRAYGGKCGEISLDVDNLAIKSWHFIKSNIDKNILISRFNSLDYSISLDTVRQNSIGRKELVHIYNNCLWV